MLATRESAPGALVTVRGVEFRGASQALSAAARNTVFLGTAHVTGILSNLTLKMSLGARRRRTLAGAGALRARWTTDAGTLPSRTLIFTGFASLARHFTHLILVVALGARRGQIQAGTGAFGPRRTIPARLLTGVILICAGLTNFAIVMPGLILIVTT